MIQEQITIELRRILYRATYKIREIFGDCLDAQNVIEAKKNLF